MWSCIGSASLAVYLGRRASPIVPLPAVADERFLA